MSGWLSGWGQAGWVDLTFMAEHARIVDAWDALIGGSITAVQIRVTDARGDDFDGDFVGFEGAESHVFEGPLAGGERPARDEGSGGDGGGVGVGHGGPQRQWLREGV